MGKQLATYHHGSLREACLKAGSRLLRQHGAEALSLREIARAAGVSPRAPYRHFESRTALLAAIAEQGFARFKAALEASLEGKREPRARLRALAHAYLEFSLAQPELTGLMFGGSFPDREHAFPELHRRALESFS